MTPSSADSFVYLGLRVLGDTLSQRHLRGQHITAVIKTRENTAKQLLKKQHRLCPEILLLKSFDRGPHLVGVTGARVQRRAFKEIITRKLVVTGTGSNPRFPAWAVL